MAKNSASCFPPIKSKSDVNQDCVSSIVPSNMASDSGVSDRKALLDLINGVEGNQQLASMLLQLAPGVMPNTQGESSISVASVSTNEKELEPNDQEFDKESFLVELRKYPSIWNKKHADYKQRNVKVNAWKKLAGAFNKDGEWQR